MNYDWAYYIILLVVLAFGLFINVFTLPGLWLMVLAALGYAWATGFAYLGMPGLVTLLVLALLAEGVEFVAGGAGAKKAGGSKRAMVGGIVGAILGGLLFSIPLPIIGTIIGVCLGAFIGAAAVEMMIGCELGHSVNVGVGAAKGRFWGIVSKLGFGIVMLIVGLWAALPLGGRPAAPPAAIGPGPGPAPSSLPASTAPATLSVESTAAPVEAS